MVDTDHRCGFVAVAGRPNVGKSTLVNRILRAELSVVTPKPQTTRNRVTGIHTVPEAQLILVDTPGIHEPKTPLNRSLVGAAEKALQETDVILLVTTPDRGIHAHDRRAVEMIKASGKPSVLAINKIDTVRPPEILPVIEAFSGLHSFAEIVPISALNGSGVDTLERVLIAMVPPGPSLFPEDEISDLPMRFFAAEIIREQIIKSTGEEIPYATAVVVEAFKEETNRVLIQADIHAERPSQKKILIGKQGAMIKQIGTAARKKLESFLECPVRLELFVKVTPRWTRDAARLKEFGY